MQHPLYQGCYSSRNNVQALAMTNPGDARPANARHTRHNLDNPAYKLLVPGAVTLVPTAVASCTGSPTACCGSQDTATVGSIRQACKRSHAGAPLRPGKRSIPSVTVQLAAGTTKCLHPRVATANHHNAEDSDTKQHPLPIHAPSPLPPYVGGVQLQKLTVIPGGLRCPSLQSQVGSTRTVGTPPRMSPAALESLLPLATAAHQPRCWNVCWWLNWVLAWSTLPWCRCFTGGRVGVHCLGNSGMASIACADGAGQGHASRAVVVRVVQPSALCRSTHHLCV